MCPPGAFSFANATHTAPHYRTLYLGAALERVCRPVAQMFPAREGYQAAIPSKHDLQAFSRAMQAELLGGLAEGGPLLLPHLARGIAQAVDLFCAKVEGMAKGGDGARNLNPLRGWVLSPEKEHNLQLLQLVAFLHQSLRRLPRDLAAAAPSFVGGAVGAGALGCERELDGACAALEALAVGGFVQPYLADVANELGGVRAGACRCICMCVERGISSILLTHHPAPPPPHYNHRSWPRCTLRTTPPSTRRRTWTRAAAAGAVEPVLTPASSPPSRRPWSM